MHLFWRWVLYQYYNMYKKVMAVQAWDIEGHAHASCTNRKLASSTGRVRAAINCGECFKPRCVYAEATLSQKEKYTLCELESNYTCESSLFSPISLYHSSIVTRANLTCHDCVDAQYYSSPLIKFKPVCSHCGGPEETIIEDEIVCTLKDRKQVVRPICFLCWSEGKELHTWGASSNEKRSDIKVISRTYFCVFFIINIFEVCKLLKLQFYNEIHTLHLQIYSYLSTHFS